mmetsp:Transcript_65682/g.174977  ORF Transcript_65682/g.174977 Transcript_65682/m.174977 type:complete len:205 (-) Transcript_65682:112-726(-)
MDMLTGFPMDQLMEDSISHFNPFAMMRGGSLAADLFSGGDPFSKFSPDPFEEEDSCIAPQYSCQTFVQSSVVDPDGQVRTERFAASDAGDRKHRVREARQAYADSASDVVKTGLERHVGSKALKVSRQLDKETGEEQTSNEIFRGLEEDSRADFEKEFEEKKKHLPKRPRRGASLLDVGDDLLGAIPDFWGAAEPMRRPALGGQ